MLPRRPQSCLPVKINIVDIKVFEMLDKIAARVPRGKVIFVTGELVSSGSMHYGAREICK